MSSLLVPHGERYLDANMNVLLIGPHGTGKTETILTLANKLSLRLKYFSCATLDPWTDLVGVPFPREVDGQEERELEMVRPRSLTDAEFIFFDELNRADTKTQSAVFEIIQFKTINGEPLPNLRACWAAINPPGEGYAVEDLDPALLDRFAAYVPVLPRPSVAYMSRILPEPIALALSRWWNDHNRARTEDDGNSYVSPRCLVDIGKVYMVTGQVNSAMPPFGQFDSQKLLLMLNAARAKLGEENGAPFGGGLGDGAADFDYTPTGMSRDRDRIVEFLKANPDNLDTHRSVIKGLENESIKKLAGEHAPLLGAIKPSILEGYFRQFADSKRRRLAAELRQAARDGRRDEVEGIYRALTGNPLPSL